MKRIKTFFDEFKKFIARGNIIDLSVGVIIGSAFSAIVTALTNKIIMPFINWLLSLGGENGLESAYTFLKKVYIDGTTEVDLTKSIFIDWGAFLTAILNFIIIAFVLFMIVRTIMKAKGFINKTVKDNPTKAERKQLKAMGINMKDYSEIIKATKELREKNKPAPVPPKPTTEQLLTEILEELKKSNTENQEVKEKIEEITNK
ncbi:MAG: large conductance mechanosensitive channel protein MscL [Clostridiales bacterium]|nr:large conductance mechanosensitive channel protein MscL [Clostridiales bacterium]